MTAILSPEIRATDRSAWLIERRIGSVPFYLTEACDDVCIYGWTPIADNALGFATEREAKRHWFAARGDDMSLVPLRFSVTMTEHQWGNP